MTSQRLSEIGELLSRHYSFASPYRIADILERRSDIGDPDGTTLSLKFRSRRRIESSSLSDGYGGVAMSRSSRSSRWRPTRSSLLHATKSPFMLVLDVAAPASILQTAGGGSDLHEALHFEHTTPYDADMPFPIEESVNTTEAGQPRSNRPFTAHPVFII